MAQHQQDNQQSQRNGNGRHSNDSLAQVTPAYPPIMTPPQAADPPRQYPVATQQQSPEQQQRAPQPQTPVTPTPSKLSQPKSAKTSSTNRRARRKWTEAETNDLIMGCREHGVGNWKKVLDDPRFNFNGRSSVDLKDRFRTCFPKEYRKDVMAEEAEDQAQGSPSKNPPKRRVTKTELHHAEVLQQLNIKGPFPKVQRRERREFTAEEDARLLQGFTIYGASWSKIQNDPALHLGHRRSTDLRDRFRNAFPDRYESAGFKARPRYLKARQSGSPEIKSAKQEDIDEPNQMPQVDPAMQETTKADSTAFIVQSLLNEHLAANWIDPETGASASSDAAPAPGSLALDPALHANFEGSTLEQLTSDLLAATQDKGSRRNGDIVRWEDMAAHPIFEVETAFSIPSRINNGEHKAAVNIKANNSPPVVTATIANTPKKRVPEHQDTSEDSDVKRQRVEVQAN